MAVGCIETSQKEDYNTNIYGRGLFWNFPEIGPQYKIYGSRLYWNFPDIGPQYKILWQWAVLELPRYRTTIQNIDYSASPHSIKA